MGKGNPSPLSPELTAELRALELAPDETIDTSDIPDRTDWSGAVRGKFFSPMKRQLSLRLDADVVDFFERQGKGYQTRMNAALREWMEGHQGEASEPRQAK
jgi:uncharacterized protein (DUF4415 family)